MNAERLDLPQPQSPPLHAASTATSPARGRIAPDIFQHLTAHRHCCANLGCLR
jgi:hypothetical protein